MTVIDIRECIELRQTAAFDARSDELVDYYSTELPIESDIALVVPESQVSRRLSPLRKNLMRERFLIGLFDLGAVFRETSVRMVLVVLSGSSNSKRPVMISNWTGPTPQRARGAKTSSDWLSVSYDLLKGEYCNYLDALEEWLDAGLMPPGSPNWECVELARKNIDEEHLTPRYYGNSARALRKRMQSANCVALKEIAEVFPVRWARNSEETALQLTAPAMTYPLSENKLRVNRKTTVKICKDDVVVPLLGRGVAYLVDEEPSAAVFASPNQAVVRCRDFPPEFLCMYLNSETAQTARTMVSQGMIERLTIRDLMELPIERPERPRSYYSAVFRALNYQVNDISQINDAAEAIDKMVSAAKKDNESIEEILCTELAKSLLAAKKGRLGDMLASDMEEINTCFANGAYKATLVMAGSVLEAILIDWLSDINGIDYFREQYYAEYKDGNGKARTRKATLYDYICAIKELAVPEWMEAEKADEIRGKRNLVHARLCLKGEDVNERVCRKVIGYLSDVIASRVSSM